MRFSFLITTIIAGIFILFPTKKADAVVWVEQISGNSQAILVVRKGNFLKVEEMMKLQSGDIVKVLDDKSSVRILLSSGTIKKISRARSPFTVAGKKEGGSFLANLVGEVKKMLVTSADDTEAVAMMTRGNSKQLLILAAGAEENLVLAGSKQLLIGWQGGKGPYKISFINPDEDDPLLSKGDIARHQVAINASDIGKTGLAAGEYQVLIESKGTTPSSSAEVELLLVEREDLPENARKLLDLKLDKRVEARFLINLLHKMPEWRFFAHSLALNYGLEKEQRMLQLMK